MQYSPAVGRNRLLNALGAADQAQLQPYLKRVPLRPPQVLHPVGEPIQHVYFPDSGMVSLLAIMKSGEQIETAIVGSEGVVGGWVAMDGADANTQSTVQIEGAGWELPIAKFIEAYKSSDALRSAINKISGDHPISGAAKRGLSRPALR